ncbi:amidase [Achromobacter denitrificans]|jgi:aspartyl-tRNA(Asn)/glutamyl-tRNA(Gln) amidotransferase subunit A
MSANTNLAKDWMEHAGLAVPENDIEDVFATATGLSRVVASLGEQSPMTGFDTNFSHALLDWAAPALEAAAVPSEPLPRTEGSCVAAVQASLDAISRSALGTLAWVNLDGEAALQAARRLDAAPSEPAAGVLHGVTIGLKDMFDRQGHVSRWGTLLREDAPPAQQDATIVSRLRDAGAINLGMLHMAEFALSPTGMNAHLGPGRNPHDNARVSGGSSSGSGMAVGAGHVPLAMGSDTGGSIRLPAAYCSVVGLKPTQYRVSLAGAMPLAPSLDCLGPLATSVDLCAAAFSAIAGPDPRDSSCFSVPPPTGAWRALSPSSLTVSVPRIGEDVPISPQMRRALLEAVGRLKEAGVHCVEVEAPDMTLLGKLGIVMMATESAALHRAYLSSQPGHYGRQVRRRISLGYLLRGTDYVDALRLRSVMLSRFMKETLAGGADACLLPATPDVAPLISDTVGDDMSALDRFVSETAFWARGINYLGLPALVVPAGKQEGVLPLGLQLVGAPLGEERLFALGKQLA